MRFGNINLTSQITYYFSDLQSVKDQLMDNSDYIGDP
ncbi:hypothetical protein SAMN05192529_102186 [Arachidicoccus rhizosphaerae]|uniref:Uncharacterized protein n=1 Tax=Arachidicoccus rhizosphaerae TaxID=551991 RepID=A0A1H3W8Y5_9BACT|nr:hypothetical protein SAMN05192529_102186 [Arachidicoccus rhizosphaerae]